jgi:hypothetical protein
MKQLRRELPMVLGEPANDAAVLVKMGQMSVVGRQP